MSNNEDLELDEQLKILGVNLGEGISAAPSIEDDINEVVNVEPNSGEVIETPVVPAQPVQAKIPTEVSTVGTIPAPNVTPQPIVTAAKSELETVVKEDLKQAAEEMAKKSVATSTPAPTVKVAPAKPAPAADNDELVFVDLAKAVNTQKTPWLRLKDNERSRILVPDLSKTINIKVHYLKGLGFVKCLSKYTPEGWIDVPAQCCKKYNPVTGEFGPRFDEDGKEIKAKNRYLLPVIEYPVGKDNHNSLIPGQMPQLKMWNLNVMEWNNLISAIQGCAENPQDLSTADLNSIDFALYKDAKTQFKTITISVTPKSFRPQFEPQIKAEIAKLTKEFFVDALKEARKVVSEETIVNNYNNQESINNAVNNAIEAQTMGGQDLDI